MNPVKICFIAPYSYPLFNREVASVFGGSEVRLATLAKGLAEIPCFQVSMIVYDHGQPDVEVIDSVNLYSMKGSGCPIRSCAAEAARDVASSSVDAGGKSFKAWLSRHFVYKAEDVESFGDWFWHALFLFLRSGRDFVRFSKVALFKALDKSLLSACARADADIYLSPGNTVVASDAICHCRKKGRVMVMLAGSDMDFDPGMKRGRWTWRHYSSLEFLRIWTLRNFDECVVQTEAQGELLKRHFGRDSILIRNPMDLSKAELVQATEPYVLWVGKSDGIKRPEIVVGLARLLPEVRFKVIMNVSDSALHGRIKDEACGLGNVEIADYIPFESSWELFAGAAILLNTSAFEGFPNTFLQAAKYGVPIVSLVVDPDGMLSEHGCGVACGSDKDAMREAVERLWVDAEGRSSVGARGIEYVKRFHDKDKIVRDYAGFLNGIIARRNENRRGA